jgi:hypothetical protein
VADPLMGERPLGWRTRTAIGVWVALGIAFLILVLHTRTATEPECGASNFVVLISGPEQCRRYAAYNTAGGLVGLLIGGLIATALWRQGRRFPQEIEVIVEPRSRPSRLGLQRNGVPIGAYTPGTFDLDERNYWVQKSEGVVMVTTSRPIPASGADQLEVSSPPGALYQLPVLGYLSPWASLRLADGETFEWRRLTPWEYRVSRRGEAIVRAFRILTLRSLFIWKGAPVWKIRVRQDALDDSRTAVVFALLLYCMQRAAEKLHQ